jgi:signal transduction histidine kinase/DNA-binding NarL/FixJ family response regulator
MDWNRIIPWTWRRYLVAILIIAIASAIRAVFFGGLGRGTAYLTYYPAVVLAALYGGLPSGLLATAISAFLSFFWIHKGFMSSVEWLAMGVFLISCSMISGIAEAMRRAEARAKQAQQKAEAANLAKSRFLAGMSHELRTPLNAILGFSRLMHDDAGLSEEQRKTLGIINRSGEHLLTLINDVLDMAKVEAGRLSVENTLLDLGGMVRDITDLLRARAEEKGLQLLLDQSSDFPRFVRADGAKLRQVLINLVGNAVKFTEQGGVTLRLNARPADNPKRLLLIAEVEDSGVGIAAEDQARIFDPFVQASSLTLQKGTGLGLAIARTYVELMGGWLSVESTPGKGSIFRMETPVEQAEESEVGAADIKRGRVVGLAPGQTEYRILIVEDQMENWLLLQRLMEGVGFLVRVAENGAAGVEMFQEWRPHLIWMDIRMPVMDGLEATRRIRVLDGGREVKIAALTASVFKEERDNVMAAGMDDFIRKPYRSEEIFDCLVRQLDVRFVYEESAAVSTAQTAALRPESLATLPRELRRELTDALVSLDTARIGGIIRRVSELDPALGDTLAKHAGQLGYTTILQALQAGGGK